jgi:ethanolamine utilization protein EutJ
LKPGLNLLLEQTERAMQANGHILNRAPAHVGVDLGTAYLVLLALDENCMPLAGTYRYASVVRDGLVVDFVGAIDLLREMKLEVEARLGRQLTHAATGYPPGVPGVEVRATANVLRAAEFDCRAEVDEPSAANAVLQIENGAIVDVGGGTTGIAVVRNGDVIHTADEPTGGTHFTLVISGAMNISYEQAEILKTDLLQQDRLFPIVSPVMEKIGTIVARQIERYQVETIFLVGGTCNFKGIAGVVEEVTGIKTIVPAQPLFVTPLGIAMSDR